MKSIVVRTGAIFVVAAIAVMGLFSVAQAQSTYVPADPSRGATYMPPPETALTGAFGFGKNPIAGAVPTAAPGAEGTGATAGTGGGLALTGSETDLPAAIAVGLLVIGGTAVVYARKREDIA